MAKTNLKRENRQQTLRQQLDTRWGQLERERATWWAHWTEITNYFHPRSGRYFREDRNKGNKRHNNIYDNTGVNALNILASGMLAGATSPARPWFRLATADPDLNMNHEVREWLDDVQKRMLRVFAKSNTYRALHMMYGELAGFGTSCSILMPDFDNVIHHYPLTIGEYCVAQNWKGEIDTMYREFERTVAEVVETFGWQNCSTSVQSMYNSGEYDSWVAIKHAIEPRERYDGSKADNLNMPWRSVYYEEGREYDHVLRQSGFNEFPVLAPRWMVTGNDVYGHSPGMVALGDVKQLQHEQLRKAQVIDYQTKPPLQVMGALKDRDIETLPGGITFMNSASPQGGIKSAWDVNLDLNHLREDIMDVRARIDRAFFVDLFLMLANRMPEDKQMTATEVAERHEEKLLMLGPVLERLHNELLEPLIDQTFNRMIRVGALPPPPEDLQGQQLSIEFVSMLAQAQRAIATNGIDRLLGTVGAVAQLKPEIMDKIDHDELVDAYSDMLGVDPALIVPGEEVAKIRVARSEALAAQQQVETLQAAGGAAKDLSQAVPSENNALGGVVDLFSGMGSGGPGTPTG